MLWRPTDSDIAQFRDERLIAPKIVPALEVGGVNLLSLSVGMGKSYLADHLLASQMVRDSFDRIIYACAQKAILNERPRQLRGQSSTKVLTARPRSRCRSAGLDDEWLALERRGCSGIAKKELCSWCSNAEVCEWPSQFHDLDNHSLIMGVQSYFRCVPHVLSGWLRTAKSPLIILDEDLLLTAPFKHRITRQDMEIHRRVIRSVIEGIWKKGGRRALESHLNATDALLDSKIKPNRIAAPAMLWGEASTLVQSEGLRNFARNYHFIGMSLFIALRSRCYRLADGTIEYIWKPWFGGSTIMLLSAELDPLIVRHRLGQKTKAIFPPHYTQHAETEVFNIQDQRMSARYIATHLPHASFAIAQLIQRRLTDNKRTMIVTRKKFVNKVALHLNAAFGTLGAPALKAIHHLTYTGSANEIPIISYGIQGTNKYQEFETCICIGAYNINPIALESLVNDVHEPSEKVETRIEYVGGIRRGRSVGDGRSGQMDNLVDRYLGQAEFNTANQAVGRSRHCTKPRLVIFCQQTTIPYELSVPAFRTLRGFRQHFGLETAREFKTRKNAEEVMRARELGLTQKQAATRTGLSLRTVKRRWHG
jgi:hypothetical protein